MDHILLNPNLQLVAFLSAILTIMAPTLLEIAATVMNAGPESRVRRYQHCAQVYSQGYIKSAIAGAVVLLLVLEVMPLDLLPGEMTGSEYSGMMYRVFVILAIVPVIALCILPTMVAVVIVRVVRLRAPMSDIVAGILAASSIPAAFLTLVPAAFIPAGASPAIFAFPIAGAAAGWTFWRATGSRGIRKSGKDAIDKAESAHTITAGFASGTALGAASASAEVARRWKHRSVKH